MINPYVNKSVIMNNVINTVGYSFTISKTLIIVDIHDSVLPFWLPVSSLVLEVPNQFFFLTIYRDNGTVFGFKNTTLLTEILKLLIALWMGMPLNVLFLLL